MLYFPCRKSKNPPLPCGGAVFGFGGYIMGHCFSHLTKTDRYRLEDALLDGKKPKEIAEKLHVHVSTITGRSNAPA